ncbi:unnamed protein product [Camellia sinensis]
MSDYIPNELIIEILVRLPVQSLLRFTSVCKSWHSLITNPSFITKHLNLFSINLPGVLNKTLGFRQNGEVLLSTTNNWLISYDPGTKTMSNTGIKGSSYSFNVDTFMETLILVKEHTNVLEGQLNHL